VNVLSLALSILFCVFEHTNQAQPMVWDYLFNRKIIKIKFFSKKLEEEYFNKW